MKCHLLVDQYLTFTSLTVLVLIGLEIQFVEPHGRLIEPPSRSSAWRYGFNTTANYNDHEIYCGGFSRQYQTNKGKCGICGDAYDLPQPRPNEAGGVYGQGVIVRKYRVDSIVRIKVELTANHKGYFEFRLCPNNNPKKIATQKCLDTHVLRQSNADGPRYFPSEGTRVFESRYLLPRGLTCTQCVMQWRYVAGNNWGQCDNGTQSIGCGPQEEFRSCADVSITDSTGNADSDQDDTEDEIENDLDRYKTTDDLKPVTVPTVSTVPTDESPSALPFVMVVIGMIIAAIVFGSLFGWFYRKEVLEFVRSAVLKPRWKLNSSNGTGPPQFVARSISTDLNTYFLPTRPCSDVSGPPPVPPPRFKKISSPDLGHLKTEEYHNRLNVNRPVTPDIISQPQPSSLSVTINGLPI